MSKKQMLIVDDNYGFREALKTVFEDDYEVSFAGSGEEAITLSYFHKPQVVLMDYKMPGLNGIQTMQLLRDEFPVSQMVIMSAYDDMKTVTAALSNGAFDFVGKPFNVWDVKAAVDNAAEYSEKVINFNERLKTRLTAKPEPIISQSEVDEMIDQTLRVACL
jgi:DNA-binding NtrC family response regulator